MSEWIDQVWIFLGEEPIQDVDAHYVFLYVTTRSCTTIRTLATEKL